MTTKEVLQQVNKKDLKALFVAAWDKSPRTMIQTMKDIVNTKLNTEISTNTANALLHKIDA